MALLNETNEKICISYEKGDYYSRGVFYGENPFNYFFPLFMCQVVLFFAVSRILYFVSRPLKHPRIVCNVLAGVLLGPSVLGRYSRTLMDTLFPAKAMSTVNTVSVFANITFIFLITVKTDTGMLLRTAREGWGLGLLCMLVPFGITYTLFTVLKGFLSGIQGGMVSFALCSLLSTSFLSDVASGLDELKLLTSELGQIALTSSMINDVIGWVITVTFIVSCQIKSPYTVNALLLFVAFMLITFFVVRPTILWIIKTTPEGKPVNQFYVVAILLMVYVMGAFTDVLGLTFLLGVMVVGLIIPNGPPLGSAIVEKSEFIVNEFLMAFSFIRLGHYVDTTKTRDWKEWHALLLIVFVGFLAKFLSVCLHSLFCKMRFRKILLLSLMLNMKGLLKFIYFIRYFSTKRMDEQSLAVLVLSNTAITAISMPLIEYFYKPHLRLETSLSAKLRTMSLQSTPSVGELRILSCIHNEDDVHGIITLIEASNPTPVSTICTYVVHLVELVGRATPLLAPYEKMGHSSTDRIMRAFTNYSRASEESVAVQPFTSIAPYKTMYEGICRLAQAKHVPLIIVPFHKSQVGEINANIRCLNVQLQAYAACTVGILVQRGLNCVTCAEFSCNIAVLFVGGADDREALALAARMSGHPRVNITLMIILVGEKVHENELEKQVDDKLLEQFRERTGSNDSVQCLEVQVQYGIEIFSWIKSIENCKYDLVMVGKRQGSNLKLEGDMESWTDYPELGVIGDTVASQDFCGGTVSVLVLQHCIVGQAKRRSRDGSTHRRFSFGSFQALLK